MAFFIQLLFCFYVVLPSNLFAINKNTSDSDFGVIINPVVQISVKGGTNEFGKKTIFSGSGVGFGQVNFTQPELISNGDAYRIHHNLRIEAILILSIDYSGLNKINIRLSKLDVSSNPFHESYYSLSTNRVDVAQVIFDEPRKNLLKTLKNPGKVLLRMMFDITPRQKGRISDRFRITVSSA